MRLIFGIVAFLVAGCLAATSAQAGSAPVTLRSGSNGQSVVKLQQYLHMNERLDFYHGAFDGAFGMITQVGLRSWQKLANYPVSGVIAVGGQQWSQLKREGVVSRLPSYISQEAIRAARQSGWAVDASKSASSVTVLQSVRGKLTVALSISSSYGGWIDGYQYTTYDGVFHIWAEFGPDYFSTVYHHAPMAYAACFHGYQCLHYDGLGASHGCIHIPSMDAARFIDSLPIGTTVVVHE